jgi:predicted CoA-binding protein
MDAAIQEFVAGKRIAIAGASRRGNKFGNIAQKELKSRGYQVFLVHPEAKEIDGDPCYPSVAALQGKVDGLLVSVPSGQAGAVLREASAAGLRNVWLQQGAETPELIDTGRELGLNLVTGKCILMYAAPVKGFHWLHRAVVKVMGQL